MSDIKPKPPLVDFNGMLLVDKPWLDDSTAMELLASCGGKLVPGMGDDHPANLKAHARLHAEMQKKLGRRVPNPGWKRPAKSLEWLARRLRKTARTVRRYCENGLVPGAFRTPKGHWRVNYNLQLVEAVRRAIEKFERNSKNKPGYVAKRANPSGRRLGKAVMDAELAYALARTAGAYTDEDERMQKKLPNWALGAAHKKRRLTLLVAVAKHLAKDDGIVTANALASALRISRATLFRLYSAKEMREAKMAAQEPAISAEAVPGGVFPAMTPRRENRD